LKNKITPILVILFILVVFLGGSVWQLRGRVKNLEGGKAQGENLAAVTPQPTGSVAGAKVDVIISPNDAVKGNPEAKVTIVEFSDFQCSYCGRAQETLDKIMETYGDKVRIVFKNYPLPFHENAESAALAALCAKDQGKFWEYHDLLFENQESLTVANLKKYASDLGLKAQDFSSCLDSKKYKSQLEEDTKEAGKVGVQGTPAFFVNGRLIAGAVPFENFKAVIDQELQK